MAEQQSSPQPAPTAPNPWLFPIITLFVTLAVNLAAFAYYSGSQKQEIESLTMRVVNLELEKKERDTYNAQVARAAEMQGIIKRLQEIEPQKQPPQTPPK